MTCVKECREDERICVSDVRHIVCTLSKLLGETLKILEEVVGNVADTFFYRFPGTRSPISSFRRSALALS